MVNTEQIAFAATLSEWNNGPMTRPSPGLKTSSKPKNVAILGNLENEFVLDYDDHEVFNTPSANMAAVF
jgi:hypothetical protein